MPVSAFYASLFSLEMKIGEHCAQFILDVQSSLAFYSTIYYYVRYFAVIYISGSINYAEYGSMYAQSDFFLTL